MIITTLQWNIGGGKIRDKQADPDDSESYAKSGLNEIIGYIKSKNPDIITLQETHADNSIVQAKVIAESLDYFWTNDIYASSHLEDGQGLGQAIISRFPISNHKFDLFYNPKLRKVWPNGEVWISHDKGISSCDVKINGSGFGIATLHMVPFRKFDTDIQSEIVQKVLSDIESKIALEIDRFVIQGDFNLDNSSLKQYFPGFISGGNREIEINSPTTPGNRKYDHVLYRGIDLVSFEIDKSVFCDHYPLLTKFEI